MNLTSYLIITLSCAATIFACRVTPVLVLKGRELSDGIARLLNLIPPAAFAALVANDLFSPDALASGVWPALATYLAALAVFAVGLKTKSLVWCIIIGVGAYALLLLV